MGKIALYETLEQETSMYESRHQSVLSPRKFFWRVLRHSGGAVFLLLISLAIGMAGYHRLEQLSFIDSFLNATMLLGAWVQCRTCKPPQANYSREFMPSTPDFFIVGMAVILTPFLHRALHRFYKDEQR